MEKYAIDIDKLLDDFEETELSRATSTSTAAVTIAKHLYESKRDRANDKPDVIPAFVADDLHETTPPPPATTVTATPSSDIVVETPPDSKQDENVIKFDAIEISDEQLDRYIDELELADNEPEQDAATAEVSEDAAVAAAAVVTPKIERPKSLSVHRNLNDSLATDVFKCAPAEPVVTASATSPIPQPPPTPPAAAAAAAAASVASTTEVFGATAPIWIPDSEAFNCMHCNTKFTLVKRRHHCRACGLVLCSKCCNLKYYLPYLNSEARICQRCYVQVPSVTANRPLPRPILVNSSIASDDSLSPATESGQEPRSRPKIDSHRSRPRRHQHQHHRNGQLTSRSQKTVTFCDGIRPGQLPDSAENQLIIDTVTQSYIPAKQTGLLPPVACTDHGSEQSQFKTNVRNDSDFVAELKPLAGASIGTRRTFAIQKNLRVHLRLITMDCCCSHRSTSFYWSFASDGLIFVGQDELCYVLAYDETIDAGEHVPVDLLLHYNDIYLNASRGKTLTEFGFSLCSSLVRQTTSRAEHTDDEADEADDDNETANCRFLSSKYHAGFIYVRANRHQCLEQILRPDHEPFLLGLLIHRWEIPWAKILPLRLVLRLGALYQFYPAPVFSVRQRDSVFAEIGSTIIRILADFRDFSYGLPTIKGVTASMQDNHVQISIPTNRYNNFLKILDESSDSILAFATCFHGQADSHLVCVQNFDADEPIAAVRDDDDNATNNSFGRVGSNAGLAAPANDCAYTTQAISIAGDERKITGVSFVIFNGVLKSSGGGGSGCLTAKTTIIEDGLMVQLTAERMEQLRDAIRQMKPFEIECGYERSPDDNEIVHVKWTANDTNFNVGVRSPIDAMPMDGVPSIRVHNGTDGGGPARGQHKLRWTEVFIIKNGSDGDNVQNDPIDVSKIAEPISVAVYRALLDHLWPLYVAEQRKIAVRVTLDAEDQRSSYLAGAGARLLSDTQMQSLDEQLVPVLHEISARLLADRHTQPDLNRRDTTTTTTTGASHVILEFIFHILFK